MPRKPGEELRGQLYLREIDAVIPFTQQEMHDSAADALVGNPRTEITPTDGNSSLVRVYADFDLDELRLIYPGTNSFNLPHVLTAITVSYNKSSGNGHDYREIGAGAWVGPSGGMNLTPSARASGSVSILPDVEPIIKETWAQNVPTTNLVFYIEGNFQKADVITKVQTHLSVNFTPMVAGVITSFPHGLSVNQPFRFSALSVPAGGVTTGVTYFVKTVIDSTHFTYSLTVGGAATTGHSAASGTFFPVVSEWPVFKPETITLTLKGQQISISQNAESIFQYSWSSASSVSYMLAPFGGSRSHGASRETGVSVRTKTISPTIHGAITIANDTSFGLAGVEVRATIPAVQGSGGAPSFGGLFNTPFGVIAQADASVTPATIAATSGLTAIPTAGLYISDVRSQPAMFGFNTVYVELVNFSYFA